MAAGLPDRRGGTRYTYSKDLFAYHDTTLSVWHAPCSGGARYSRSVWAVGHPAGRAESAVTLREVRTQMSTLVRPEKTVLVVEDDPWIRSLMADLLVGEGYAVVQASDGKAGLEMAEENDPDVILLDLAMPEKSGLDVLHELKSSKPTRDIPVIVVSAYAMLMMGSDARRADGVIQKPFDLADLLLQVEQAAAKRRQAAK